MNYHFSCMPIEKAKPYILGSVLVSRLGCKTLEKSLVPAAEESVQSERSKICICTRVDIGIEY